MDETKARWPDNAPHSPQHERDVLLGYARLMACRLEALAGNAKETANHNVRTLQDQARALRNFADEAAVGAHFRDPAGDRVHAITAPRRT